MNNTTTYNKGQIEVTQIKEINKTFPLAGPSTELYCVYGRIWINDHQFYKIHQFNTASLDYEMNEGVYETLSCDPEYEERVDAGEDIYDIVPVSKAERLAKEFVYEGLSSCFLDDVDGNKFVDDETYRKETLNKIVDRNNQLQKAFETPSFPYNCK